MRNDSKIRAIIGRQSSGNTMPVTYSYENSQIVYLSVSATQRNVIRHKSRFIFRLLPNSDNFAKALVEFCIQQNYRRLVLLYARDSYNEELAYAFRDYAIAKGLSIVFEKSFFEHQRNFVNISADMKEVKIDAIFLTTLKSSAVRVVQDMRGLGIKASIIGSDLLDSEKFTKAVGDAGNGMMVPTIYNPFSKKVENASFVNAFRNAYGNTPNTWGAQGYDAVKILADAMMEAKSTVPTNIATALRHMPSKQRASGEFVFNGNGELQNKPIYFKELQNGRFILFKDSKQEEEQSQNVDIVNDQIFRHPEKPSESMEALSIL
jgi:branched-chain amino acid transport system substrate-binding protein